MPSSVVPLSTMTRRMFAAALPALAGAACVCAQGRPANRLTARPTASPASPSPANPAPAGLRPLGLRDDRDALLYIPESAAKFDRAPLVVSLHGATRNADRGIELLRTLADRHGFLLLAPASAGQTWDAIGGIYAPDPAFINKSLARTFELRKIDPARIAMAGFSDGASYSLSIGLANGDLFRAVFGFSPGFIVPGERAGKPPVFISHGVQDNVLPIDSCSRRIVPQLKSEGYRVTYREFEGKHTLPPEIAAEAMQWFMES
ncbi:MAG TPA: PHB depolymerase family esterase [Bryobacteraceae bacterium]